MLSWLPKHKMTDFQAPASSGSESPSRSIYTFGEQFNQATPQLPISSSAFKPINWHAPASRVYDQSTPSPRTTAFILPPPSRPYAPQNTSSRPPQVNTTSLSPPSQNPHTPQARLTSLATTHRTPIHLKRSRSSLPSSQQTNKTTHRKRRRAKRSRANLPAAHTVSSRHSGTNNSRSNNNSSSARQGRRKNRRCVPTPSNA